MKLKNPKLREMVIFVVNPHTENYSKQRVSELTECNQSYFLVCMWCMRCVQCACAVLMTTQHMRHTANEEANELILVSLVNLG